CDRDRRVQAELRRIGFDAVAVRERQTKGDSEMLRDRGPRAHAHWAALREEIQKLVSRRSR
ncbi:MAG: hypothetical protein AAEJ52_23585, partial [Myxococcota bacterium]